VVKGIVAVVPVVVGVVVVVLVVVVVGVAVVVVNTVVNEPEQVQAVDVFVRKPYEVHVLQRLKGGEQTD
jgi:hypothetical protein